MDLWIAFPTECRPSGIADAVIVEPALTGISRCAPKELTMSRKQPRFAIIIACAPLAVACVSTKGTSGNPARTAQQPLPSLSSARAAILSEQATRLSLLQRDLGQLESRLSSGSSNIREPELTSVREQLRRLRQRGAQTQSDIELARIASAEDWDELQAAIASAIDGMQGEARRVSDSMTRALNAAAPPPTPASQLAPSNLLCSLAVADEETVVRSAKDHVEVLLSSRNRRSIATLRRVAEAIADTYRYKIPGKTGSEETTTAPARISVEETFDGIKLKFSPEQAAHLSTLEDALEKEAVKLDSGGC